MTRASILPTADEVRAAAARLDGLVERTPLVASPELSAIAGGEVLLKLECLQDGGSFKLRGALHAMLALDDAARARGVVASSAGNHGIGIAMAAARLGVPATVFVPASAPTVKREKIAARGATVIATEPTYDAAEAAARAFAAATGATFVSPCTGRTLLAGAGTVALEVMTARPDVATLLVCVGGGGLAGGVGGYLREAAPAVRIVGAQSVRTNAMSLALTAGRATDIPDLPTLADGLAGLVDAEMLAQGQAALDAIVTVEEEEIAEAIRWLHTAHGVRVEGSGAVGVAALRSGRVRPAAFPVAVTVSGANIDAARWAAIVG
ncbi:MAG: pyridoxal-phosphate dependent enzyme [Gemmatimonadota bacterium]|jgi:threonine dehydratase|nr:pyridoxal-phosphate dependent enzyme [Gemmatimonadota bacterium]MDQ8146965.1 pyridoxal-phosphate dependent enzyme [Gemmatimonadota bacterium]MDQ8148688.1 pyridoxal-phosphate dependent enzyme [Gemmatimonadota bacterium]MDQ8176380.1 pyridoxal-phosphate dependent enzyme [Gemmatimonadota bacterium]